MDHETYQDKIGQLLANLPSTSKDIATYLQAQGIKGHLGRSATCPIANYLAANLEGPQISVSPEQCDFWIDGVDYEYSSANYEVANPWPVTQFICDFDNGLYLELVEDDPENSEPRDH